MSARDARPVRVVVDGGALGDGSAVRGIGAVLRPLLAGLAQRNDIEIVLLSPPGANVPSGMRSRTLTRRGPGRFAPWEHLLVSGMAARGAKADVAWFPANLPPVLPPRPFVVTVHDAIPLQLPDPGLAKDRRRWRVFGPGIRRADAVLCPSQATADVATDVLRVRPDRTRVVPWGVGQGFVPDGPVGPVGPPHLLWVSAYDAHKGLADACALVAGLAARGLPHRLRLVGPFDAWNRPLVEQVVAASARPDLVDVVGWVDDLAAAYRAADVFVITSRLEGFGLPPVEAQACGTPVVGFASPAVTEVAGPGARLVPLGDLTALVDAAAALVGDPTARAALVAGGLANAARFTWDAAVDAYADALRRAASSSR
jgi:glycosyltransferase involved in cell wall biosynthesis